MMRRTVLLLATTALTLIAAGGIALAATLITCTTNPCEGTTEDDVITGTVGAETINGQAGNDEISARDANDTLNGEDGNDTMHGENGTDRLNGGVGDDTLDGGPETAEDSSFYDYYLFTPNWGNDTIIDGRGRGVISMADAASAAAMPNLTVNLVSDPARPEVSDGNGNTMNWENNDVKVASTGAGEDVISQRPTVSNGMNGGAGNDTYKGYTTEPLGSDSINDASGTADVLDLSSRSLASARWTTPYTTNARTLRIDFHGGTFMCSEAFCNFIDISYFFDDTSPDVCASGPGAGLIETIKFADDPSVDFEQVKNLAASQDGTDNDRDGNTDEWGETCAAPTPPETTISSGPSGYVKSASASFSFTSSKTGSTFQCSRDDSTYSVCTPPRSYTGLSQGSHTFRVYAYDTAGNFDASPATRSWFVDTVVPKGTISINGGAASTSSRSVTLKVSASDPSPASGVASMRFRNGGTTTWSQWFDYSTSTSWTLSAGAGTKTVYAQFQDRAGNVSAAASDTIRFSP
jgi:RTX calcium-binding nonapeptide repeat (4 copies)